MQFVKHEILPKLPSHGRIIVSQLLPFPRLLPQYEDAIKTANNLLNVEISKTDNHLLETPTTRTHDWCFAENGFQ